MLSLLKKRSEAAAALTAPSWHPNFRNYEKLPDIKAVRTAFFVNGASIAVAVSLLLYFGIKEWQLMAVNSQIGEEQRKIDRDKRPSEQVVSLFKKFQEQEARVLEVDGFVKSKPLVSALLMRLGETLPANVAIDTIDLRMDGMALRLSVRGDAVAASGYATQYLDQLKADKELGYFGEFVFSGTPTRNPTTGRMAVEFFLRFKPTAAGGKK
jgi:hypothetical protein